MNKAITTQLKRIEKMEHTGQVMDSEYNKLHALMDAQLLTPSKIINVYDYNTQKWNN